MVTNVSYALLDAPVIAGHGDDVVLGTMTHARLLEEVAALGGVLLHLGVGVGDCVVIDLEPDLDAVVAALATARIGAVVSTSDHPQAPVVVASAGSGLPAAGRNRILRGDGIQEPDLEWVAMIRAGRTDPAAVAVLDAGSAYSPDRSVAEQLEVLSGSQAPYDASELRRLLQV